MARDETELDLDEPVQETPITRADEPVHEAEILVSTTLRLGVATSAGLILLGLLLGLLRGAGSRPGGPPIAYPTSLPAVLAGIRAGEPLAFGALGLLVLIATPILNVGLLAVAFATEPDWPFVAISLVVLLLIGLGFALNTAIR